MTWGRTVTVVLSVAAVVVIAVTTALYFASRFYSADAVVAGDVSGPWESTSDEMPARVVLNDDGTFEVSNASFFDPADQSSARILVRELSESGEWATSGGVVRLVLRSKLRIISLQVLSSPLGGLRLQSIIGDHESPLAVQTFTRE